MDEFEKSTGLTPVPVPPKPLQMAQQNLFCAEMFGFKRDEVLTAIGQLTQGNEMRQQELDDAIEHMQMKIEEINQQKQQMEEALQAQKVLVENQVAEEQESTEMAMEQVGVLRTQLQETGNVLEEFKRLQEDQEQELAALRVENLRLNSMVNSLTISLSNSQSASTPSDADLKKLKLAQEELTHAKQQVEILQQEARQNARDMDERVAAEASAIQQGADEQANGIIARATQQAQVITAKAQNYATALRQQAEAEAAALTEKAQQEAEALKRHAADKAAALTQYSGQHMGEMQQRTQRLVEKSTESISNSIKILKAQLMAVDEKIAYANTSLQTATQCIAKALHETENDLAVLGGVLTPVPQMAFSQNPYIAQPSFDTQPSAADVYAQAHQEAAAQIQREMNEHLQLLLRTQAQAPVAVPASKGEPLYKGSEPLYKGSKEARPKARQQVVLRHKLREPK